jgi:hypothetical protein
MLGLMLGALTGHLLPCEKLLPEHMGALSAQGFKALLITDAQRMLSEQVRRAFNPPTQEGRARPFLWSSGGKLICVVCMCACVAGQEAAVTEMEREGVELLATAPHGLLLLPLLPRVFGVQPVEEVAA